MSGASLRIDTTDWIAGALVIGNTGGGVLGSAVPATGQDGPGFLYQTIIANGYQNNEVRALMLTYPSAGTLVTNEDTSFTFTAPDGSYTATYGFYLDYVLQGTGTIYLQIGVQLGGNFPLDDVLYAGGFAVAGGTISGNFQLDDTAYGGGFAVLAAISGNFQVDDVAYAGGFTTTPSILGGGWVLDDVAYAGGFGGGAPTTLGGNFPLDDVLYSGGWNASAAQLAGGWTLDDFTFNGGFGVAPLYTPGRLRSIILPTANLCSVIVPQCNPLLPGAVARLECLVTDVNNMLADPGTIMLTVQMPGQMPVVYGTEIVRDDVGKYHFDLLLPYAGSYPFKWVTTGANQGVTTDGLYVWPEVGP